MSSIFHSISSITGNFLNCFELKMIEFQGQNLKNREKYGNLDGWGRTFSSCPFAYAYGFIHAYGFMPASLQDNAINWQCSSTNVVLVFYKWYCLLCTMYKVYNVFKRHGIVMCESKNFLLYSCEEGEIACIFRKNEKIRGNFEKNKMIEQKVNASITNYYIQKKIVFSVASK